MRLGLAIVAFALACCSAQPSEKNKTPLKNSSMKHVRRKPPLRTRVRRVPKKQVLIPRVCRWIGGTMKQTLHVGIMNGQKYPPALNLRRKACLNAYRIDRYPVTVDDFKRCTKAGKCPRANAVDAGGRTECNWNKKGRGRHPINCVNWFQAQAYCRWAGGNLPSEAEWEIASGSQHGHYPWGKARPDCKRSVIDDKQLGAGCGVKHTHPVGSKPKGASEFGLMDTIGNVQEWTRDCISLKAIAKLGLKGRTANYIPCVIKGYSFLSQLAMSVTYKIHGMEGTSYRDFLRREIQEVALGFRCMYPEKQ